MVKFVETMDDFKKALKDAGDKLVVVDFTATWCGPCRAIGPYFEELSGDDEFSEVVFLKVDVDKGEEIAASCKVSSMPTFQYFRNGVKLDELVGASRGKLLEKLRALK